ncbi:hypothetical protein CATRI_08745 [Corynebacterium atrinae]|uniref:DUF3040 domain-containing protein n=1 Tax=Corynebacterium atrinae TaxID=1336740 RepID=UPI0025B3D912|nr:DUF3040 domain-containing protein [Corynebacterium atrinae]WJY63821.1 hypothetical protein CATRI_08745 [Corynebacterium atrinae]
MSLSEQEQRALREIEQSLLAEDPKFGASVSGDSLFGGGNGGLTLRGVAIAVVGLLMLIGGVALAAQSLWFIALSVVGFLVMFGAGVWMLRGNGSSTRKESSPKRAKKAAAANSSSLGNKMEENFRRRFEDQ